MKRGIIHGCAVSALLFILAVEFLSIQVKSNERINGLKILKKESKILQYADDNTLTIIDKRSILHSLTELQVFASVSGLNINKSKSHGIWLGNLSTNIHIFEGIEFSEKPVKCLGIFIGKNKSACQFKNWDSKINNLEMSLSRWKSRNLTYLGKSIVLNTLLIPKLVYNITVLHVPDDVVKRIEKNSSIPFCGEKYIESKRVQ